MDKKAKFVMMVVMLVAVFVSAGMLYSRLSENKLGVGELQSAGKQIQLEETGGEKMGEVIVTKENFDAEVVKSKEIVLIDFWAEWCGPCRMLSPVISEIADEYAGRVKVCKVNVDEQPELAVQFQISAIPALVVMKNGNVSNRAVGYMGKNEVVSLLELGK